MSPKIGIGDIRREQLTEAAMKCIASKGYNRVTLEDVSQEAGLSKGIASYYFKNREDLLVSVIRRMRDHVIANTKTIYGLPNELGEEGVYERLEQHYADPEIDLARLIHGGVRVLLAMVEDNPVIFQVVLEFWCQIPHNPAIADFNQSLHKHLRNISAIVIAEGIKRGVFKKRDPQEAAFVMISSISGIALNQVLYGKQFEKEVLAKAIEDMVFGYLLEK
ncbi:MAG: TetR/AcrR family transcriptional regulator [Proteobacteria bacterium]|nr:TetR/AcrR family transcriptional regulator [Pseudomonadota bacterium]